jgi:ribosome recycling factor
MIDQIIASVKPKITQVLDNLNEELTKIRTGRAHAGIVDSVFVSYYGTRTALREVATITTPEPTVIAIKPWDKNVLSDIESAIRNSDLGLSPVNDGIQIRLILSPMTEDRRKEIALQVKKCGEQAKISIRTIRGEAWSKVQTAVKNKEATEDDKYSAEEQLNKIVEENNKQVDKILAEKEAEVMKI